MKKVAIYTRVSTTDGQTVENQRRDLNLAAERLGWTIVAHYSDEGIQARKAATSVLVSMPEVFDLYLHVQGLDTSTPSGRAMFQMLGVFSEFERAIISERVRASLRRVKAEGQRLGRPPLDPVKDRRIRKMLNQGISISQTAKTVKCGLATVHKIKTAMVQAV